MTASSSVTDKVLTGLVGAAVALVPLLASSVTNALQSRSARSRRDNALTVAKNRVDFLSGWIKAQEDVCTPDHLTELKLSTSHELDDIRQSVLHALADTEPKPAQLADRQFVQKLFLLYSPRSPIGWLRHAFFYIALGVLVAWFALAIYSEVTTPTETLIGDFIAYIIFSIPVIIFAVVMQRLARRADKAEDERIRGQIAAREAAPNS